MKNNIFRKSALIITVMLLVFSLSGCGIVDMIFHNEPVTAPTSESTTENTTETTETTTEAITEVTTEATTELTTVPTTESTTSEPDTTEEAVEGDKVWARNDVNIREKPSTESKILGTLIAGESVIRTEITSNGWSKVIYEGAEAYIATTYLTSTDPTETVSSDRVTVDPETDLWNLVIVNNEREIPADYVPKLEEVASSGIYLDYRVAPHYNEMYAAAKNDGITLTPFSGYRSYDRQKRNYNNLTETYMSQYKLSRAEAAAKAATVILPPGTSEHNLGIAMDICNTNSSFSTQKEFKWLTEHAHEYGFILRYTAEKQSITGIISEPWHWRYVGVEHAEKIKNSGLCLEEYLTENGIAY